MESREKVTKFFGLPQPIFYLKGRKFEKMILVVREIKFPPQISSLMVVSSQ